MKAPVRSKMTGAGRVQRFGNKFGERHGLAGSGCANEHGGLPSRHGQLTPARCAGW